MKSYIPLLLLPLASARVLNRIPRDEKITAGHPLPTATIDIHARAIVPTTAGQIGVNPVSVSLSPTSYANIHYHTLYSEYLSDGHSWTATNTEDITATVTMTVNGSPTTTTEVGPIAVNVLENGDISILMTPELLNRFKEIYAHTPACARKRQELCGLVHFVDAVAQDHDGVLALAERILGNRRLINANDINAVIAAFRAAGRTIPPRVAIGAGIGSLAMWVYHHLENNQDNGAGRFTIPGSYVGGDGKDKGNDGDKSELCPAHAPKDDDAPVCDECKGQENICTEGEWKHCECFDMLKIRVDEADIAFQAGQQRILAALENADSDPTEMSCSSKKYEDAIPLDVSFVERLAAAFCKGDLSKGKKAEMSSKDVDSTAYDEYKFTFEYRPGNLCFEGCEESFKQMAVKCMGYDSHNIQKAGSSKFACGAQYKYSVSSPEPETPADGSKPDKPGPDSGLRLTERKCYGDSTDKDKYKTFNRDDALKAIDDVCGGEFNENRRCLRSESGSVIARAYTIRDRGWCMATRFSMVDGTYSGRESFKDKCRFALMSSLDDCDTKGDKRGGFNKYDCVGYDLMGTNGPDNLPCNTG
ncbi:hypothetical protein AJ79_08513 [Helicocarpus griseus UAMH5409]|uniref:Uncharacterized protein n=1 Tax=Helicocarpus griseus UAMH5409 TaxID=1447875 RepID=A0A2B7WSR5_9EURO|nr:hypothetical protein AJ79_08513 [Helicocarpus griseus UAMH5409]